MAGPRRIKIEGEANLVRDMHSKAIINPNARAVAEYKRSVTEIQQRKQQTDEINSLKDRMSNIEDMLKQILGKLN